MWSCCQKYYACFMIHLPYNRSLLLWADKFITATASIIMSFVTLYIKHEHLGRSCFQSVWNMYQKQSKFVAIYRRLLNIINTSVVQIGRILWFWLAVKYAGYILWTTVFFFIAFRLFVILKDADYGTFCNEGANINPFSITSLYRMIVKGLAAHLCDLEERYKRWDRSGYTTCLV